MRKDLKSSIHVPLPHIHSQACISLLLCERCMTGHNFPTVLQYHSSSKFCWVEKTERGTRKGLKEHLGNKRNGREMFSTWSLRIVIEVGVEMREVRKVGRKPSSLMFDHERERREGLHLISNKWNKSQCFCPNLQLHCVLEHIVQRQLTHHLMTGSFLPS